ncbi:MAG: cbb3-type cytochrome c oxidase subunit II [Thermoanaerobaculia bacterium]|nr:cbb3-type cytochrome c oxidase subunit II [Thermoanaerobaculia bacterium]
MSLDSRPSVLQQTGGLLSVVATYVVFLLWDQFGFLRLLHRELNDPTAVRWAMAAMGLAGLAASLGTARWLAHHEARFGVVVGLLSSAVVANLVVHVGSFPFLVLGAIGIGASTGVTTVALASGIYGLLGPHNLGLKVGTATGLGYAACNVPWLFEASPQVQAGFVAVISLLALAILSWSSIVVVPSPVAEPETLSGPRDDRGVGFVGMLLCFLALIWLDSAAFAIIQESTALKALTWGGEVQKLQLGAVHLLTAVVAGYLVDRGRFGSLLLGAFTCFAVALPSINAGQGGVASVLYATGISFYSVALVLFPSSRAETPGALPIRWRAGIVFGIAGWLGSALGVGMAQDLHRIPGFFVVASGLVIVLSLSVVRLGRGEGLRAKSKGWTKDVRIPSLFAVGALALFFLPRSSAVGTEPSAMAAGRAVYVAEGCINCHSQYVRPGGVDEQIWGPYRPVDRSGAVVLIGNRRQGPDLLNVGNRRSQTWQRLHLENPRALVPGSRMPSYSYLFRDGDSRGPQLIDYLASLGRETEGERRRLIGSYHPSEDLMRSGSIQRGAEVFAGLCSVCHGPGGQANTELAVEFGRPAMNLRKGSFWLVSWGGDAEPLEMGLARLIKFGAEGTEMPGHEWLPDGEIADLVAYVLELASSEHQLDRPFPSVETTPLEEPRG